MPHPRTHVRSAVLATASLAAVGALVAGTTSGAVAAPPPGATRPVVPADAPRTAFETNGGNEWTTLEQEDAFLTEVDERSDVMSLETVGTTPQGRPITLVRLGQAQDATAGEVPTSMLQCLQHGNEPAAREACLRYVRDLALATDKTTTKLLKKSAVLILPTANPDGRAANTRANSEGVDINRDHLLLQTVEAQTIARLIRDESPDTVTDVHEYGGTPGTYDRDLIYLWPRNLNVDDRTYGLARELNEVYTERSVRDAGFTSGIYGQTLTDPPVQVAGDEDERIFRNMVGLRHVAGQLIETYTRTRPGETTADNRNRRVNSHVAALDGAIDFFDARGGVLAAQSDAAAKRATAEGRSGKGQFFFGGADNEAPTESQAVDAPCGYTVDAAQLAQVAQTLDLHGIETTPAAGGGAQVTMGQPARGVIPFLLDGRAPHSPVDAVVEAC